MKRIVITEGFYILICNSYQAILLFLLIPYLFFSFSVELDLNYFVSGFIAALALIMLVFFLTESKIINEKEISRTYFFGLFKRKFSLNNIKVVNISYPIIASTGYNYVISFNKNEKISFGFLSIEKIKLFIDALKEFEITMNVNEGIYKEIEDWNYKQKRKI